MLRPGSAIKRKTKAPSQVQIAQKQVSSMTSSMLVRPKLVLYLYSKSKNCQKLPTS